MSLARDPSQTSQRIKVGMVGLAVVVLLIAVASAIIGSMTRERPIATAGSAQADVVANMAIVNAAGETGGSALAELGVVPSTGNSQAAKR